MDRRGRNSMGKGAGGEKKPPRCDPRKLALRALIDVNRSGAYANLALDTQLKGTRNLSFEDRRFAAAIFYAALENKLRIEWVLKQFVAKMPDRSVEDVLHIAAAQLLFLDRVPDHAVVDEAVKQARALGKESFTALVNGALRSLIRARDGGEIRYPSPDSDQIKYLSVMHSLPEDLARRLIGQYGMEEAARMIAYRPDEHNLTIRPNLLRHTPESFAAYLEGRGIPFTRGITPYGFRVSGVGHLAGDPDYRNGQYSIQGEGSILPCLALAPKNGQHILDACAAPGGKASLICEMMHLTGRVQAWDLHDHRCELLRAAAKRLKLDNLRVVSRDAAIPRPGLNENFDAVLVDAPCSGLGVMIDKPDIKYRVSEASIQSLSLLQERILDVCSAYVKVGGRLVYSTCTILKEENQDRVKAFLAAHPEFETDPDGSWLPDPLRPYWQRGWIQVQAHRDGIEGFFIARFRRTAS